MKVDVRRIDGRFILIVDAANMAEGVVLKDLAEKWEVPR